MAPLSSIRLVAGPNTINAIITVHYFLFDSLIYSNKEHLVLQKLFTEQLHDCVGHRVLRWFILVLRGIKREVIWLHSGQIANCAQRSYSTHSCMAIAHILMIASATIHCLQHSYKIWDVAWCRWSLTHLDLISRDKVTTTTSPRGPPSVNSVVQTQFFLLIGQYWQCTWWEIQSWNLAWFSWK